MTGYSDLADLKEDDRIQVIGNAVMQGSRSSTEKPKMMAFVVEDAEKAQRYVDKLVKAFPSIRIIDTKPGPVKDTIMVRVAGPLA